MNRKLTWCLGLVLLGLSGLVVAQDIIPRVTEGGPNASVNFTPVPDTLAVRVGDFKIVQMNDLIMLLDRTSGATWRLTKGKNGPGWVPLPRIGQDEEERNDEMTRANVNRMKKEIEAQIDLLHEQLKQLDKQQ